MAADGVVPDVRDGLTPGCRRALWALGTGAEHRSAAQVVDAVLRLDRRDGRRRAIYAELIRMARPWELRHPLVDAHGDLGSLSGDEPASADYTAMRLAAAGSELLAETNAGAAVPAVLPARFPNLLVNGSFSVATGAASRIPPHNLREVVDATLAYIDDPLIGTPGLMQHMPGPDFPTGAIVDGDGLREAYAAGRGQVVVRARADVEDDRWPRAIIVTELPFAVANGGRGGVVAELRRAARKKRVSAVARVADESGDAVGLRIVIELEREADPDEVLQELYARTRLQVVHELHLVAAVNRQARTINLRDAIEHYVEHRHEVVARRTGLRAKERVRDLVRRDLLDVAASHGDERRTEIR